MTQAAIAARRAVWVPTSEAVHHKWQVRIPGWVSRASSAAGPAGYPSGCVTRAADDPYGCSSPGWAYAPTTGSSGFDGRLGRLWRPARAPTVGSRGFGGPGPPEYPGLV
ncbi:hypothetical protein GCM10017779_15520 [Streptomyces capillispiralis]|nr:hypothetical protein GCM10017779_15520 [Streptomyces capillispiralis]